MTAYVATRGSLLSQHAAHVLAIGIPAAGVVIGLGWDAWRRRSRLSHESLPPSAALWAGAVASAVAASVHAAVVPEHLHEAAVYGAFFVVAAVCQLGGAVLMVVRRSRLVVMLLAAGNALLVMLWILTRVVGVPLGPRTGVVEPVGAVDVLATTCELVIVACCVAAVHRVVRVARSVPAL